jgi:hypothetical protein
MPVKPASLITWFWGLSPEEALDALSVSELEESVWFWLVLESLEVFEDIVWLRGMRLADCWIGCDEEAVVLE